MELKHFIDKKRRNIKKIIYIIIKEWYQINIKVEN